MTDDADVLIIGAGPAGSALAIRLAGAGLRVFLLDRSTFPRPKPCAEYLSPEALRHLDLLGMLAGLEPAGRPFEGTTVVGPRGARLTGRFAAARPQPFRPTGLALPRLALDAALARAASAAGAVLRERTQVVDLTMEEGRITGVVLLDGAGRQATLRARVTVGADGLRSVVSKRLGGRRYGLPRRLAFVAHMQGVTGLGLTAEMHVGSNGYVGLNPLLGECTNVSLVVPADCARAAAGNPAGFFLRELASMSTVRDRIREATTISPVSVTGPFAARSRRVVADGALLVGDAAEFFDPFTGEGVCAALKGAELAADALLNAMERPGPVTAADLEPYLSARRQAFMGKWMVERLIGFGMLAPWLFDRAVDRIARRGLADTFLGVTGDFVPAIQVLNPLFLSRMVL